MKKLVTEDKYQHPNFAAKSCCICGIRKGTALLKTFLTKNSYDVEAACDTLDMDPCEVICPDCYKECKEDLDTMLDSDKSCEETFDSKKLKAIAKKLGLKVNYVEFQDSSNWSVELDTKDEELANDFRFAVGEVLDGTENTYGASYDDLPGMGDIHLGCVQGYEWEELNGGDEYDDLDPDYRDSYVVFACPAAKWKRYRQACYY